jgi:hypothetical protein
VAQGQSSFTYWRVVQEHDVFPTHYKANTEAQVRALAQANGFEVLQLDLIATDAIFAMLPPLAVLRVDVDSAADDSAFPETSNEYDCGVEKGRLMLSSEPRMRNCSV